MTQENSTNGGYMTPETRLKLVAASEALAHELTVSMSIGGNVYEQATMEELHEATNASLLARTSSGCGV